jgi:2-hydroxy-6-oxonona-2,4-dienedioate hydrolase
VFVHGYGISGWYFVPLAQILSADCASYAPDLPGSSARIAELAELLGAWIDVVGLQRPVIVANSMGCQIVTQLAVLRPERVGPMVLVGPTVDPDRRGARRQMYGILRDTAREPVALLGTVAKEGARQDVRRLIAAARSALADRLEDRLPLIDQPTVVVHGGLDGLVSRDWAERVAALLPRGRLVAVPDEPHATHFTRPDLVAEIVRDLIAEELAERSSELAGRLPHRDMAARQLDEARVG